MLRLGVGLFGIAIAVGGSVAAGRPTATASGHSPGFSSTQESAQNEQLFSDEVAAGIARFEDVDVAYAEGYAVNERAAMQPGKRKHFRRTVRTPEVLDPTQPEGLVYYVDGDTAILLGAVYVERSDDVLDEPGVHWHDHSEETGNENAPNMMHVWTYDGVADPLGTTFTDSLPAEWQRGDPWPFVSTT